MGDKGGIMKKSTAWILALIISLGMITYAIVSGNIAPDASAKTLSSIKDKELLFLIENAPTEDEVVDDAAVFLLYEQKTKFDKKRYDSSLRYVVKILDEGAVEEFGQWDYLYNAEDVKVDIEIARTIDEDGTIHNVPKDMVRRVKLFPDYSEYQNLTKIFVTFPSLKKNSIIDLKFATKGTPSGNWAAFGSTTYALPLGYDIMKLKLEIDWPKETEASYYYKGFTENEITITEEKNRKKLLLNTNNYRIFHANEVFRPPYKDIGPYVLFSLYKTWDDLGREDKEDFFDELISDDKVISRKAEQIVKDAGAKTREEKIKALYDFLTQDIRYIDLSFMYLPEFKSNKAKIVLKNKYADCKGMASLLISFLDAVDIPAYFALVPSYWFGDTDKAVPSNHQFNHVIVAIPEGEGYLFLDPTASFSRYPYLPGMDQGILTVLLKGEGCEFQRTPLLPPEADSVATTIKAQIEENGGLKGRFTEVLSGGIEMALRGRYEKTSRNNLRKQLESSLSSVMPGVILNDFDYSDPRDTTEPFTVQIDYSFTKYAQKVDDLLFFSVPTSGPLVYPTMYSAFRREYPFYFPALSMTTREIIVNVPQGYKIKKIPEKFELDTTYCYIKYELTQKENQLIAREKFMIKKREIPADMYQEFKEACNKYTSLRQEDIVFQKK